MRLVSNFVTLALALAAFAVSAFATDITYQNDTITGGGNANVQAGFVKNEIAAAVFTSPPANGPIFLQQARVLFYNALGQATTRKMRILVYASGAVNPGVPIYTSPIYTFLVGGENLVSLSSANIEFSAGQTFTIGAKFEEEGLFINFSSVVTDTSGITPNKNRIFDIATNSWKTAESVGLTGDFGIRAVVTPNGPTLYGAGTTGTSGIPTMDTFGPWKVGSTSFGFQGASGALNSTCYLSLAADPYNFPILDITILVDPITTVALQAPTNGAGNWFMSVPIPADPMLAGQDFFIQVYFVDGGAPSGVSASPGLKVIIASAI